MNTQSGLIKAYAKHLKLPTVLRYEEVLRLAQAQGWGYEQFLVEILRKEITQRQENQMKRRIRNAHFPLDKSLDDFRFHHLPNVQEATVWQLATGEFVKRQENVIMIGNPGTGKTHLAIGLGRRLCKQGLSVRFYTAANLVTELSEAQEFHRLTKLEKALSKVDLLIVDELSYLTFSKAHAELLFHVLSNRNERGSVLITTNLEFSRWGELFPNEMLTAALIDRLTHHAYILDMNAESYRLKQRIESKFGSHD
ncbi:IS21-like element helper ATPase IstB [Desulforamulus ferrireducens]|uniref:AAA family ATPase n=1 Tax=Desulforamulus ferrireducens TaxID=1833852 RepID=A0A1S6IWE4_9FIRM|nr:IS21-like element helper ATPase IstB [Desulforamulus ferrireducens]AQS58057.1 AAA family ATPase [Desulforamulus ferrireducens]AQS59107.1 AAA family ATPase [Desulforamulus ferrireducens]